MRVCNDPSCATDSAGLGVPGYWTSSLDVKVTSGATIVWYNAEANRIVDSPWGAGGCWSHPPVSGHWGSPFKIFRVTATGSKMVDGTDIRLGDAVIFERMNSGSWAAHYVIGPCGAPTTDVLGSDWKSFAFNVTEKATTTTIAPA